jgi:hypothetical protein
MVGPGERDRGFGGRYHGRGNLIQEKSLEEQLECDHISQHITPASTPRFTTSYCVFICIRGTFLSYRHWPWPVMRVAPGALTHYKFMVTEYCGRFLV